MLISFIYSIVTIVVRLPTSALAISQIILWDPSIDTFPVVGGQRHPHGENLVSSGRRNIRLVSADAQPDTHGTALKGGTYLRRQPCDNPVNWSQIQE